MNSRGLALLLDWSGVVGIALSAIGLLSGAAVLGWTTLPLILIGVGILLSLVWVVSHRQVLAQVAGLRSTQTNTNIVISAVAFLVILVLLNGVAVRFDREFDLSEDQFFSLSPQTIQVLEDLDQPVKIWWVSTSPAPSVRESLERYQAVNPEQLEFELLNPRRSPLEAQRLGVTQDGVLVVESGERQQELTQPTPQDLESQLTPLIVRVVETQSLPVYFVQGHGELPLSGPQGDPTVSQAVTALEQDGFTVEELTLVGEDPIPNDGVLVIAGSELGFLPGEVDKLKDYLEQAGKLALLLNPQVDLQLDLLLEDWGIELQDDVVVDRFSEALFRSGPFVALGASYGSHPITEALARQQLVTLFPLARSIETSSVSDVTTTPLVLTNPQGSWGEIDVNLNRRQSRQPEFDPDTDIEGPLQLAVAFSREVESGDREEPEDGTEESEESADQLQEARLVVFGNANFVVDGNFNQQGNGDLFLNSVNWLAEQGERISIRPKAATNRRFTLTAADIAALRLVALAGLPALALGTGIGIWWQRR